MNTPAIIPVINLNHGLSVTVLEFSTGENGSGMLRPEARVSVMVRNTGKPAVEFWIGEYDGLATFDLGHTEQYHGAEEFLGKILDTDEDYEAVEECEQALRAVLEEMEYRMNRAAKDALQGSGAVAEVSRQVLDMVKDGTLAL